MAGSAGAYGAADSPAAFVVLLAPSSWVPHELRETERAAEEDYCVCVLEKEAESSTSLPRMILPGGQLHSMDRAIADGQFGGAKDSTGLALRVAAMREVFSETGAVLAEPAPPRVLRTATREILRRDGPRTLLDCMIVWDNGNPFPRLTLSPLEELAVMRSSKECFPGELQMHFFVSEVPDAEELTWMEAAGQDTRLAWMAPSEIIRLHKSGKIHLEAADHLVLDALQQRLSRLDDLPRLFLDGPVLKLSKL
eukprot:CAMPEP_0197632704 /NCGR_PEP_ID=MMETSP1338-20131121/9324_1 /TAXON_ID=43686 ORGANISM="Pelagodinium beii, Strain RCC1491" /NCGR_SAMPLE_ID=MMETSP1338 /ASSEMBLY_ACC=CAM_ASM_000754 /LENGTH=251 /DNA_ID=CAMNT_0043204271 /DNA_START=9 /DNA_END=764 /DNA_ORIENTATION=+